jgi:hypothetical protein
MGKEKGRLSFQNALSQNWGCFLGMQLKNN